MPGGGMGGAPAAWRFAVEPRAQARPRLTFGREDISKVRRPHATARSGRFHFPQRAMGVFGGASKAKQAAAAAEAAPAPAQAAATLVPRQSAAEINALLALAKEQGKLEAKAKPKSLSEASAMARRPTKTIGAEVEKGLINEYVSSKNRKLTRQEEASETWQGLRDRYILKRMRRNLREAKQEHQAPLSKAEIAARVAAVADAPAEAEEVSEAAAALRAKLVANKGTAKERLQRINAENEAKKKAAEADAAGFLDISAGIDDDDSDDQDTERGAPKASMAQVGAARAAAKVAGGVFLPDDEYKELLATVRRLQAKVAMLEADQLQKPMTGAPSGTVVPVLEEPDTPKKKKKKPKPKVDPPSTGQPKWAPPPGGSSQGGGQLSERQKALAAFRSGQIGQWRG